VPGTDYHFEPKLTKFYALLAFFPEIPPPARQLANGRESDFSSLKFLLAT
jgi:hypothetical protein